MSWSGLATATHLAGLGDEVSLGRYTHYLIDPHARWNLGDALEQTRQGRFQPMPGEALNLGYTDDALWLRFELDGAGDQMGDWLLEFDYPLLDRIDVWTSSDGGPWRHQIVGDSLPFAARPLAYRTLVVPLQLAPATTTRYFIRIVTTSSMQVHPTLYRSASFFEHQCHQEMFFGLVYGIMLLMAVYNLFLLIAIRDPVYLAYIFVIVSGTLLIMALNGHTYQYLWPGSPQMANVVIPVSASLWVAGTAMFSQLVLETRRYAPLLGRMVNVAIALAWIVALLSPVLPYRIAIQLGTGLGLVSGLLLFLTSVVCWRRGNPSAGFFTAAWVVFATVTTMLILSRFGVLPDVPIVHNSATVGLVVEVLVLSFALTDKYRRMTNELTDYAHNLEQKVSLRTTELEQANERLEDLSQRDSLTRLANRRRLDMDMAHEWQRHHRNHKSLALLVCDIDYFKGLNDHYGHQYGDECLRGVAEAISRSLRRPSDLAARFGGDEMVVLLPETDLDGAIKVADRVQHRVQALALEHIENPPTRVVTLSIGVGALVPTDNEGVERLFQLTDQALYRAKKQGRNRVVGMDAGGKNGQD